MLETALGSFVVDTYYKISPSVARFALGNAVALSITVAVVSTLYWCLENWLLLAVVMSAMVWFLRKRRIAARSAAVATGIVLALVLALPVPAMLLYQTTEQLAANATDIVSGKITSVDSYHEENGARIYSDIVVEISDTAKGTMNKQSTLTITQVGGRVGGLVTEASDAAEFRAGETVLLYLQYVEGFGYRVYNGAAGKVLVSAAQRSKSAAPKVVPVPDDVKPRIEKSLPAGEAAPETMPVEDYMALLRDIVKEQEAAKE